jgi:CRP-like cAMP-binding protein
MKNEFLAYMSKFTELSEEEAQLMIESYPVRNYKKGSELLRQGQIARDAFLVLKGSIRKY